MNPYDVIKFRYQKEKSGMLLALKDSHQNKSAARCSEPKYVFVVSPTATKPLIAWALEQIYASKQIDVRSVNTLRVKSKPVRFRSKKGYKSSFKKAVVTLRAGDDLDAN